MPTYGSECTECGARFDVFQHMSDEPTAACPHCGGPGKRLLGGGAGIIMKGSRSPAAGQGACDRERPCCGRDVPCDAPPCSR